MRPIKSSRLGQEFRTGKNKQPILTADYKDLEKPHHV